MADVIALASSITLDETTTDATGVGILFNCLLVRRDGLPGTTDTLAMRVNNVNVGNKNVWQAAAVDAVVAFATANGHTVIRVLFDDFTSLVP